MAQLVVCLSRKHENFDLQNTYVNNKIRMLALAGQPNLICDFQVS